MFICRVTFTKNTYSQLWPFSVNKKEDKLHLENCWNCLWNHCTKLQYNHDINGQKPKSHIHWGCDITNKTVYCLIGASEQGKDYMNTIKNARSNFGMIEEDMIEENGRRLITVLYWTSQALTRSHTLKLRIWGKPSRVKIAQVTSYFFLLICTDCHRTTIPHIVHNW